MTILELAERVRDMAGSTSEIVYVAYSVAYEENFEDMPRRVPSLEKIRRTIGWTPEKSLDEILESVIDVQQARVLSPSPGTSDPGWSGWSSANGAPESTSVRQSTRCTKAEPAG